MLSSETKLAGFSTTSLPSYVGAPSLHRTPSYSAEPHDDEQRIALADHHRPRPTGKFVKQNKNGLLNLTLDAQEEGAVLPLYGQCASVSGIVGVNSAKVGGVTSVDIKINGRLSVREIGEGGKSIIKLRLARSVLWSKDESGGPPSCPTSLPFTLELPPTFEYEAHTIPLPPTFDVKLSGLPGFIASIEYTIVVSVTKPVPLVKSKLFNLHIGETILSTAFIYHPRTRPASPLPAALTLTPTLAATLSSSNPEWHCYSSELKYKGPSHSASTDNQNLTVGFYVPTSRTFCMTQSIPFYMLVEGAAPALAAFSPIAPNPNVALARQATKVQLFRQASVDVSRTNLEVSDNGRTEMWRVDCIGEGTFKHAGDGPTWMCFSGEILVHSAAKVTGFRAGGLTVQDFITLTITPPDLKKVPFSDLRLTIPVRLATDAWVADGTGIGANV